MYYINMKGSYGIETIDQFETMKEAKKMVYEYNLSDSYNYYYISSRSTKQYREEQKK